MPCMFETPQTFASKTAIIEVLKRNSGAAMPRRQVLEAASSELDVSVEDVASALDALQLEQQVASVVVDGEERIQFTPAAH